MPTIKGLTLFYVEQDIFSSILHYTEIYIYKIIRFIKSYYEIITKYGINLIKLLVPNLTFKLYKLSLPYPNTI